MGTKMHIILCRAALCLSEAEDGVVSWWQVVFISWMSFYFLGSGRVFSILESLWSICCIDEQGPEVPVTVFMDHHHKRLFPLLAGVMTIDCLSSVV